MTTLDTLGMADLLGNFPKQIEEALEIGERFKVPESLGGDLGKIVFVGMGGSAIGGDVVHSLVAPEFPLPIWVSRHYDLPPFVDAKTLCIFSSYSGNTEETISAFRQALKKKVRGIVITSGGELARLAGENNIPWIEIPKGFPPRAALGYSVFPVLKFLSKLNLCPCDPAQVEETLALLKKLAAQYAPASEESKNPARQLARTLFEKLTVIYAGTELLDSAAFRFRTQIEENAKAMASHHLLPEMNHNEILGWQFPKKVLAACHVVFLEDAQDHPRIRLRVDFTKEVIQNRRVGTSSIHSQGKSRLARLFSVVSLGDWTSYYLALLYGIDPTPVVIIESLKKELARVKF